VSYDLSLNKLCTVSEMRDLGWEEGGVAWVWHRHIWTWEEELLVECMGLLPDFVYQPVVEDRWVWRTDPDRGYTVRGAYSQLTFTDIQTLEASSSLI
jgi:hypothetical protein